MEASNFIMNLSKPDLYKFVEFYYTTNEVVLKSKKELCFELNLTESKLRSLISLFLQCSYLYKDHGRFKIFLTKRNFSSQFKVVESSEFYEFWSKDYLIKFSKMQLFISEPKIKIKRSW